LKAQGKEEKKSVYLHVEAQRKTTMVIVHAEEKLKRQGKAQNF
jgi:hypothetical protein